MHTEGVGVGVGVGGSEDGSAGVLKVPPHENFQILLNRNEIKF